MRRSDHGARILVVDDDALTRRHLQAILEREYYTVKTVGGGLEALGVLPCYEPHLVLMDVNMPGMDGLETCRRIRSRPDGDCIPIIFLTADERPQTHAEALHSKGDDFLRKPIRPTELITRIRSLMRLKRLQAEIQAERDQLIDLQKQREHLFHFIVHDLKNPLTTIQLGLDLLSDQVDRSPTTQHRLLRLQDTAQYMGRMIQNILDIGRSETLEFEINKVPINLHQWLLSLLPELDGQLRQHGHTLGLQCSEHLVIEADPDCLRRVLLNLLENALKYSPSGSHTDINVRSTNTHVHLEIRDQGCGIPSAKREYIFGKFIRLEGGPHERSSSGLGLTFCRLVAEAHNWLIWVEENQPKGSVFVVKMPLSEAGVGCLESFP
jgi:signal transduction histidine kinase